MHAERVLETKKHFEDVLQLEFSTFRFTKKRNAGTWWIRE